MTTVPKGTSLTTWAGHDQEILDSVGNLVETGQFDKIPLSSVEGAKTFLPGAKVPNYTLLPPEGLRILGNPTTVKAPTMLSDLLQPNAGNVQWAACLKCVDPHRLPLSAMPPQLLPPGLRPFAPPSPFLGPAIGWVSGRAINRDDQRR